MRSKARRVEIGPALLAVCCALLWLPACGGDHGDGDPNEELGPSPAHCQEPDFDLPVWRLDLEPEGLETLLEDVWADVSVGGTLTTPEDAWKVEVELHGASARAYPKKGYKLEFTQTWFHSDVFGPAEEQTGFPGLILKASWKDQSLMREWLAFAVLRLLGQDAPLVGWAHLVVNGDYQGLFVVIEPLDERYLTRRGHKGDGALYKGVGQDAGFHSGVDVKAGFEKKTHKSAPYDDLEALLELVQTHSASADGFWDHIDPVFSVDRYVDRLIWASFTQNNDSWRQNFYLYHEPGPSPRRWWIHSWDADITFANHWIVDKPSYPIEYDHMLNGPTLIGRQIAEIPEMRGWYIARFETMLDGALADAKVRPLALAVRDKVARDLACDLHRWKRPSTAADEFGYISNFLDKRPPFLRAALTELATNPKLEDQP